MGLCASSLGQLPPDVSSIYDLPPLPDIDGNPVEFAQLKGKVSRCPAAAAAAVRKPAAAGDAHRQTSFPLPLCPACLAGGASVQHS